MNEDINGDDAMQRFDDLGRKLFQAPKPKPDDEAEIIEDDQPEADE